MRSIYTIILLAVLSLAAFGQQAAGDKAKTFSEETITGEVVDLEQMAGKVVVLTFWSTRCQICVAEIPKLNRLVDKYPESEVVFVGLAWQDKQKLDEFLAKVPFKFKIVPQSLGVLLKYADRDEKGRLVMGFPSHFVVSQSGQVVFKGEGFDKTPKIEKTIASLLSEQVAEKD